MTHAKDERGGRSDRLRRVFGWLVLLSGQALGVVAVVAGVLGALLGAVICGSPEASCDEGAAYWFAIIFSIPIGIAVAVAVGTAGWRARDVVNGKAAPRDLAVPALVAIALVASWFAAVYGLAWLFPA